MAKPNWENRTLFHGDNLDFMRAMDSETVDLIATDPPFNKNKDFHSTPGSLSNNASFQDRWKWRPEHDEWLGQMKDDNPQLAESIGSAYHAHSESMGAFICFLAVRAMSMHRLLKPTGSLFLHCDPTASHYVKASLDAIFGRKNFRNEIIWHYGKWSNAAKCFQKNHDVLFWYAKTAAAKYNIQHDPPTQRQMDLRKDGYTTRRGQVVIFNRKHPKVEEMLPKWKDEDRKVYYSEEKLVGRAMTDVWRISSINGQARERTGYPTQKPIELYSRIIKAASNPGEVVLDPFAGCATTCVAAALLERQWVGIDIWKKVAEVVKDRIKREELPLLTDDIFLVSELPKRTDGGETSAPYLRTPVVITEPSDEFRTRKERVDFLIKQYGLICQGCGRNFDHKSYLQLDHILPRADGGWNHIRNRCFAVRTVQSSQISHIDTIGAFVQAQ